MRATYGRTAISALAVTVLPLMVLVAAGQAAEPAPESPVVGRYSVVSPAGGAVWTFRSGGELVVVGPLDLISQGRWTEGGAPGEFDAMLAVEVTAQELTILGSVSPDGRRVALYVLATEATAPQNWDPWPSESRLLGVRVDVGPEESPSPTPVAVECLRPAWAPGAVVDWDRCDGGEPPTAPGLSAAPGMSPAPLD